MTTFTQKQRKQMEDKFVAAIAEGKNQRDAVIIATGNPNRNAATVKANRILKKTSVQARLKRMLKSKRISLGKALDPIAKGLKATKMVDGVEVEDLAIQLRASDRALKLLAIDSVESASPETVETDSPADTKLQDAIGDIDEIELQKMIFRKSTPDNTQTPN